MFTGPMTTTTSSNRREPATNAYHQRIYHDGKNIPPRKNGWGAMKGLEEFYRIFGPVKDGDFHTFMLLNGDKKPDFDYENSRLPPKSVIYPESERMFEYSLDETGDDAHILKESPKDYSPCAIVGIRPCDAHAFQIVKRNFDTPEYQDPWWTRHFESTTLVGLGCNDPCTTCFCTQVGGDPFNENGLDVLLFDLGEKFLAKAITDKGEAFLEKNDRRKCSGRWDACGGRSPERAGPGKDHGRGSHGPLERKSDHRTF